MYLTAIKQFRDVGNAEGVAAAMGDLAGARLTKGELERGQKMLEDPVPNYAAVDDKEGVALHSQQPR